MLITKKMSLKIKIKMLFFFIKKGLNICFNYNLDLNSFNQFESINFIFIFSNQVLTQHQNLLLILRKLYIKPTKTKHQT